MKVSVQAHKIGLADVGNFLLRPKCYGGTNQPTAGNDLRDDPANQLLGTYCIGRLKIIVQNE